MTIIIQSTFFVYWCFLLVLALALTRGTVGVTVFFAAVTALYTALPACFYAADAALIPQLFAVGTLAVLGFAIGSSGLGGFRESITPTQAGTLRTHIRASIVLMAIGAGSLALLNPKFLQQLQSYEGRIAFQGEQGPQAFLLNQIVIGSAIILAASLVLRRYRLAIAVAVINVWWAIYSNHKLSLLTTAVVFIAWIVSATAGRMRAIALGFIVALPPIALAILIAYSVIRGGAIDSVTQLPGEVRFAIEGLGSGVLVGDFDGPYHVLASTLSLPNRGLGFGATYVSQWPVLIPRAMRGDFADLSETFAMSELGVGYRPGVGFAYSPWAEGVLNFGLAGALVEGVLIGLLSAALARVCRRVFGYASISLVLPLLTVVLFQRGYLIGQVKNYIVYVAPYLAIWQTLRFRIRSQATGRVVVDGPSDSPHEKTRTIEV